MSVSVAVRSVRAVRVTLPGGLWPARAGSVRDAGTSDPADPAASITPEREVTLHAVTEQDAVLLLDTATAAPGPRATALLARCVPDGDTVVPRLTVGDREALLLHLRRLTFGDVIDCVLGCPAPSCGAPMDLRLRVSELLLPPYPEVRPHHEVRVREAGVDYEVGFRLPTAGDVDEVAVGAGPGPDDAADELLRRCLLWVHHGVPHPADAGRPGPPARARTERLPAAVRGAVAEAMAGLDPQASLELELVCPECAEAFSVLFDAAAFLLRELSTHAANLLRDVHSLAWHYHWSEADILTLPAGRRARYLDLIAETQAGTDRG